MIRNGRRYLALLALVNLDGLSSSACNGRFEYDIPRGDAGAGDVVTAGQNGDAAGGDAAAGQSKGGANPAAGASAGTGPAGCGTGPVCPSQLHCVEGSCVQCAADTDCNGFGLLRCQPQRHRCVECLGDVDCPAGSRCDPIAHRCLTACSADLPCPPDAHGCDEEREVCYACDEDYECDDSALGSFCAADGSGCAQCRGAEGCSVDQHCDELSGRCVECRDGSDCDSRLCDPDAHICLPPSP